MQFGNNDSKPTAFVAYLSEYASAMRDAAQSATGQVNSLMTFTLTVLVGSMTLLANIMTSDKFDEKSNTTAILMVAVVTIIFAICSQIYLRVMKDYANLIRFTALERAALSTIECCTETTIDITAKIDLFKKIRHQLHTEWRLPAPMIREFWRAFFQVGFGFVFLVTLGSFATMYIMFTAPFANISIIIGVAACAVVFGIQFAVVFGIQFKAGLNRKYTKSVDASLMEGLQNTFGIKL